MAALAARRGCQTWSTTSAAWQRRGDRDGLPIRSLPPCDARCCAFHGRAPGAPLSRPRAGTRPRPALLRHRRHGAGRCHDRPLARRADGADRADAGLVAAYAAIFSPLVATVDLDHPPPTHMAPDAPAFLNILRVADVPTLLGLIAPRPLSIRTPAPRGFADTVRLYAAAGSAETCTVSPVD